MEEASRRSQAGENYKVAFFACFEEKGKGQETGSSKALETRKDKELLSSPALRRTEPDSALNRKTPTSGLDGSVCVVSCHLLFGSLLQH